MLSIQQYSFEVFKASKRNKNRPTSGKLFFALPIRAPPACSKPRNWY